MPASAVPDRMAFVPGGDYRLIAWSRPTDRRVRLADYFIDKYEVSNREFKEFISAGGYVKRELLDASFHQERAIDLSGTKRFACSSIVRAAGSSHLVEPVVSGRQGGPSGDRYHLV